VCRKLWVSLNIMRDEQGKMNHFELRWWPYIWKGGMWGLVRHLLHGSGDRNCCCNHSQLLLNTYCQRYFILYSCCALCSVVFSMSSFSSELVSVTLAISKRGKWCSKIKWLTMLTALLSSRARPVFQLLWSLKLFHSAVLVVVVGVGGWNPLPHSRSAKADTWQ
jgi:hypothetical protein